MFRMIAKEIKVDMFVGICDFEYKEKQPVVVSVIAYGNPSFKPTNITECLDYSRVCTFVAGWTDRPHVDLVETLLHEVAEFCFEDPRIHSVNIEVVKPAIIPYTTHVGVGLETTREKYFSQTY